MQKQKRSFWMMGLAAVLILSLLTACTGGESADSKPTSEINTDMVRGIPTATLSEADAAAFSALSHHYLTIDNSAPSTQTGKAVEVAEDGSFFDDFNNGIDPNVWGIAMKAWGGGNHGVIRENVAYTADGLLVMTANGDLYEGPLNRDPDDKEGVRSGACLVTQHALGAGSYEVRMKVAPQMGACTAMWTFFWASEAVNHEIDIELPASTKNFKNSQFVTWTGEEVYTDRQTIPDFYHNDGQWHTYRFDWHTSPEKVDFYVDDEFQLTIEDTIPTIAGHFWLGVWFPKRWCGVPNFDTTYMLVDWVKYTAYDEPFTPTEKLYTYTPENTYPTEPVVLPTVNFISNGGFEVDSNAWTATGSATVVENPDTHGRMLRLGDDYASVTQTLTAIIPQSQYNLNVSGFGFNASAAKVKVEYLELIGDDVIGSDEMALTGNGFAQQSLDITTPENAERIRITLSGDGDGPLYFDDVYLTQPARGDFNVVE